MKKFTWNDLAEAINKLPENEREKQVIMTHEDESHFRNAVELATIPEDIYFNNDDEEDGGTLEDLKYAHGEDFNMEDYKLVTTKGTPFLSDDF